MIAFCKASSACLYDESNASINPFNSTSLFSKSVIFPLITRSASSYAFTAAFNLLSISSLLFDIVSFKSVTALSRFVWTLLIAFCKASSACNNSLFSFAVASFNSAYVTYVLSNESKTS